MNPYDTPPTGWEKAFWIVVGLGLIGLLVYAFSCGLRVHVAPPSHPETVLLRSFGLQEQRQPPPPHFDDFIVSHAGKELEWKEARLAEGRRGWQYFDVLFVHPEVVDGTWWADDAPWFTWLGQKVHAWDALLVSARGDTAHFTEFEPYCNGYVLNWAVIDSARAEEMVQFMRGISPGMGLFWDQFWLQPAGWMFPNLDILDVPAEVWFDWEPNIRYAYELAAQNLYGVLVNGDWINAPGPVYIENGGQFLRPFEEGVAKWREDPKHNVFSVRPNDPYDVVRAVAEWTRGGGILSFSGPGDYDWAYAYADSVRRE